MSEPVPITAPDLGTPSARLSLWHVRVGEAVYAGDRVAELVIPGAVVDVPAPASGTVRTCVVRPNDPLHPGQILGLIDPEE